MVQPTGTATGYPFKQFELAQDLAKLRCFCHGPPISLWSAQGVPRTYNHEQCMQSRQHITLTPQSTASLNFKPALSRGGPLPRPASPLCLSIRTGTSFKRNSEIKRRFRVISGKDAHPNSRRPGPQLSISVSAYPQALEQPWHGTNRNSRF